MTKVAGYRLALRGNVLRRGSPFMPGPLLAAQLLVSVVLVAVAISTFVHAYQDWQAAHGQDGLQGEVRVEDCSFSRYDGESCSGEFSASNGSLVGVPVGVPDADRTDQGKTYRAALVRGHVLLLRDDTPAFEDVAWSTIALVGAVLCWVVPRFGEEKRRRVKVSTFAVGHDADGGQV